jgi:hypothetical protein
MFTRKRSPSLLENERDRAIRTLRTHETGSEEYVKTLEMVTKLHNMKESEKPSHVSKDTLAVVSANLLGIFMIIKHEHVNVITSKAMNLLIKPR